MDENNLTEEQLQLLEKALKLYSLSIDLHKECESDYWESNKFYEMVSALEAKLNTAFNYY